MGGIHGASGKESRNPAGGWAVLDVSPPTNKLGERFLNGAIWGGVRRGTTSAPINCWTKDAVDEVNVCTAGHTIKAGNGNANYDY